MPVQSSAEFLEILQKSRLLTQSQLDSARKQCEQEQDPKNVARSLIRDGSLNKWQALHLLAGRYALTLGKYRFLDQIDADERQRLYLAEHPKLGRQVEIQTLSRRHVSQNPEAVKQFLEQGRRLALLEHPTILHIYDVDSEGDRCFIVFEHVQGRRLSHLIAEQGPLPMETVVDYLSQLTRGLGYAHERGFFHGDLRPSSVLVDERGNVRLANLGFADLVGGSEGSSSAEQRSASADGYAAPEMRRPGAASSPAGDIYALGALTFAMLTGREPQPGSSVESLLEQRPEIPRIVVQLFEKMMAADATQRYANIADVAKVLEQCWEGVSGVSPASEARSAEEKQQPFRTAAAAEKPVGAPARQVSITPPKRKPAKRSAAVGDAEVAEVAPEASDSGHPADDAQKVVVPGLPEAPVADVAPGTLAINTKARRRKKATGVKAAAAKPSGDASAGKAGIPKAAYVAGGAAVGGLVLITAVVLLFMFVFSGRDDVQVGQGEASPTSETEAAASDRTTPTGGTAESDPELNVEANPLPEETDPELTVAATPDPAVEMETRPAEQPSSNPAAGTEQPSPPAPTGPSAPGDAGSGTTEVGTAKPETIPAEMPQPAAATTEKPSVEKPATAAAKPDAKPEPKKPSPAPPAAKPKTPDKKAFAELPPVLPVPALDAAVALNATPLGKIYAGEELCFIRMRGGEGAFKGSQSFAMRNANGGLDDRAWEIYLREGNAGSETKIAHLSLDDQSQLVFQWEAAAQDNPAAGFLANCVLSSTCRGDSHVALLRQTTQVPTLEIDLNEPAIKQDWDIAMLPDPEKVRVEITGLKGAKYTIEPQPVLNSDKGEAWIKLEDGGGLLSLKVETDLRKDFQILVSPYVRLSSDAKPEKLIVRRLQPVKAQLEAAVQQWNFQVQQGQAMMKSKAPEQQKKQVEQYLRNYENELKNSQQALEKFTKFEEMLKNTKLQLSFRVFYDADGSEVNLLKAGG